MMAKSHSMVSCGILLINRNCLGRLDGTSAGKLAVTKPTMSLCPSALETASVLKSVFQWVNTCIFHGEPNRPSRGPAMPCTAPDRVPAGGFCRSCLTCAGESSVLAIERLTPSCCRDDLMLACSKWA